MRERATWDETKLIGSGESIKLSAHEGPAVEHAYDTDHLQNAYTCEGKNIGLLWIQRSGRILFDNNWVLGLESSRGFEVCYRRQVRLSRQVRCNELAFSFRHNLDRLLTYESNDIACHFHARKLMTLTGSWYPCSFFQMPSKHLMSNIPLYIFTSWSIASPHLYLLGRATGDGDDLA